MNGWTGIKMTPLRRITQACGTLLAHGYLAVLACGNIYQGPLKGICLPFISCYACPLAVFSCPIGSLQHFAAVRTMPVLLLGALGLVGLSVGRMACGWLCPFGLLQELLFRIPTGKIRLPRALRHLKYITLVFLVLLIPYLTGAPWFSKLCPFGTLTAGIPWVILDPADPQIGRAAVAPGDLGWLFAVKLAILGGFLALFVIAKRPFCRIACPLGAILSLFSRVSMVRLKVSRECRQCGKCRDLCPVDVRVSEEPNSPECIRCLNCTSCKHVSLELGIPVAGRAPEATETKGHGK
jgi:ferredoxin-type protein NapH